MALRQRQPLQSLRDDRVCDAVGLGTEAFVKTFKRDYVYVHDRPDAQTVLSHLSNWFEDYNEVHPHKALQMKSPREFIRSHLQPAACPVGATPRGRSRSSF